MTIPTWQKEPKLARARQIPEWETYDSEIARFARTLADEGKIRSHVAAADSQALASANAAGGVSNVDAEIKETTADVENTSGDGNKAHVKDEL